MSNKRTFISTLLISVLLLALAVGAGQAQGPQGNVGIQAALGTAFTYQGQLKSGGSPVNGNCDLQFSLWDAASGGTQIGATQTKSNVTVSDGIFTTSLDFGSAFTGDARWLEIAVRCPAGSGAYTTLSPRQALTAAPYALYAKGAPWSGLTGVPADFADGVDNGLTLPYSGGVSSSSSAFYVENTGSGLAIYGKSSSIGVRGEAPVYGVIGYASSSSGGTTYGVFGASASTSGRGVYGYASATSGTNYGVYGESASTSGYGVFGYTTGSGTTYGVYGESISTSGYGVYGYASATSGTNYGVRGASASTDGYGVYGEATATSGITYGVYGKSRSTSGYGVYGEATATSGITYGVDGRNYSTSGGAGVRGYAKAGSGANSGVYGRSDSTSGGAGVYGYAHATSGTTYGVYGESRSTSGYGVFGWAFATSGTNYGVYGVTDSASGYGVYGRNNKYSSGGNPEYAGYFVGDVRVTGNFSALGGKSFQIDHPLDPANRYLYHFAQEGPEVQNVYNGVVTLDANGEAVVTLPAYFEALNAGPYRYQLTPIGAPMPDLYIAEKINNNRFKIAGGTPGMEVSWEVTAVRHDPYLRDHPAQAEVDKPAEEQGTYLYPEGYGQPKEMGLDYQPNADLFEQVLETEPPSAGDSK